MDRGIEISEETFALEKIVNKFLLLYTLTFFKFGGLVKVVCFFVAFFLFSQGLVCQEGRPETFMDCCRASIIEIQNGKIHVQSNRFSVIHNEMMFLSNTLEWIPVSESAREILGHVEDYVEECRVRRTCLKEHVGFYWSPTWRIWFCLNECPYNFYKNFPNGKGE